MLDHRYAGGEAAPQDRGARSWRGSAEKSCPPRGTDTPDLLRLFPASRGVSGGLGIRVANLRLFSCSASSRCPGNARRRCGPAKVLAVWGEGGWGRGVEGSEGGESSGGGPGAPRSTMTRRGREGPRVVLEVGGPGGGRRRGGNGKGLGPGGWGGTVGARKRATTKRAGPHPVPSQLIFVRKSGLGRSLAAPRG